MKLSGHRLYDLWRMLVLTDESMSLHIGSIQTRVSGYQFAHFEYDQWSPSGLVRPKHVEVRIPVTFELFKIGRRSATRGNL